MTVSLSSTRCVYSCHSLRGQGLQAGGQGEQRWGDKEREKVTNKPTDLTDFTGIWRIERVIDDLRLRCQGRFQGQAELTPADAPQGADLRYYETGTLSYGLQAAMTATRSYVWRQARGAGIEVLFEDARAFHTIDLSQERPMSEHRCPPDIYQVTYDFSRWPRWSSLWRASGPAKNYRSETCYTPAEIETRSR